MVSQVRFIDRKTAIDGFVTGIGPTFSRIASLFEPTLAWLRDIVKLM